MPAGRALRSAAALLLAAALASSADEGDLAWIHPARASSQPIPVLDASGFLVSDPVTFGAGTRVRILGAARDFFGEVTRYRVEVLETVEVRDAPDDRLRPRLVRSLPTHRPPGTHPLGPGATYEGEFPDHSKADFDIWVAPRAVRRGTRADYDRDLLDMALAHERLLTRALPPDREVCPDQEARRLSAELIAEGLRGAPAFEGTVADARALAAEPGCDIELVRPQSLPALLYLAGLTPKGRLLLARLLALLRAGTVAVRMATPEAHRGRLPRGAVAYYGEGAIWLKLDAALLDVLPAFVHEAAHAVDLAGTEEGRVVEAYVALYGRLMGLAREGLSREQAWASLSDEDRALFDRNARVAVESEHKAYAFGGDFADEFEARFPGAFRGRAFGQRVDLPTFRWAMVHQYNIPERIVDEYVAGLGEAAAGGRLPAVEGFP